MTDGDRPSKMVGMDSREREGLDHVKKLKGDLRALVEYRAHVEGLVAGFKRVRGRHAMDAEKSRKADDLVNMHLRIMAMTELAMADLLEKEC